jgi:hypothetical protein
MGFQRHQLKEIKVKWMLLEETEKLYEKYWKEMECYQYPE